MSIRLSSLYLLILFLVYINISYSAGSDILVFAMCILVMSVPFIHLKQSDCIFIGFLTTYYFIMLIFVWEAYGEISYLTGAIIQFSSSIFLGVCTYRLLLISKLCRNKNILKKILIIYFIFLVLELFDVTRNVSNYYRQVFLGVTSDIIAIEHVRDLQMTKWFIRPNVFSKEASLAYLFFFVITCCYLLNSRSGIVLATLVITNLILFVIFRTPSAALTLLMYFSIVFFNKNIYFPSLTKKNKLIFNVFFIMFVFIFLFMISDFILERFSDIDFNDVNRNNSITIRVVAPLHFMFRVLSEYPLFGIGLGNLDVFRSDNVVVGNNATFYLISFLGIVGTITLFLALAIWLYKEKQFYFSDFIIIILFFICLTLQTGAILNFRLWFYFFSFVAYFKTFKELEIN